MCFLVDQDGGQVVVVCFGVGWDGVGGCLVLVGDVVIYVFGQGFFVQIGVLWEGGDGDINFGCFVWYDIDFVIIEKGDWLQIGVVELV